MTAKKKPRASKYATMGLPDDPPWTGKYASLRDALMIECVPGKPMPDWLYESLVIVFDQYMRGTITNLGDAFGAPVMRAGEVRKWNLSPGIYQWITALRERDPTIALSKKKPRGAYCQAAIAFGISASTAEIYYNAYRDQMATRS